MPKVVDHEAQREAFLEKAFEFFADKGYSSTSVRKLAGELGVSTGTLYHYFGSKEAIFEQMVSRIAERDITDATAAIPEDADTRLRLQLLFAWIWGNQETLQRVLLLIFDFQRHRPDPEARPLIEAASRLYRVALEEQVGAIPGLWSLILGMLIKGLLEPSLQDPDTELKALLTLLDRAEKANEI